jgi:hypothetical protein
VALINCPECDSEISDKATSCPRCGSPLNTASRIQIQLDPKILAGVKVSWNGEKVGTLRGGRSLAFDIQRDGVLTVSGGLYRSKLDVAAGKTTKVFVTAAPFTGKMRLQVVDTFTSSSI